MKKLYNSKSRRIHPSPPPPPPPPPTSPPSPWCYLAVVLPAAVLTLAAALSSEDQEVLAYLLSCGVTADNGGRGRRPKQLRQRRGTHEADTGCGCFGCYKSFWARWDASPNRHVIHLIVDVVEESLLEPPVRAGGRRRGGRRKGRGAAAEKVVGEEKGAVDGGHVADDDGGYGDDDDDDDDDGDDEVEGGESKSSVRRLVSFIGERVWGVWTLELILSSNLWSSKI